MLRILQLCIIFLEITICFNESLFNESTVHINEDEGSASFSLVLSNSSSHDLIIVVNTTDGAAIGKILSSIAILSLPVHSI